MAMYAYAVRFHDIPDKVFKDLDDYEDQLLAEKEKKEKAGN